MFKKCTDTWTRSFSSNLIFDTRLVQFKAPGAARIMKWTSRVSKIGFVENKRVQVSVSCMRKNLKPLLHYWGVQLTHPRIWLEYRANSHFRQPSYSTPHFRETLDWFNSAIEGQMGVPNGYGQPLGWNPTTSRWPSRPYKKVVAVGGSNAIEPDLILFKNYIVYTLH